MSADATLLASQVIWQIVTWPLVLLLGLSVWRRRATEPLRWIPATAIVGILVASAFGAIDPTSIWYGAAWFALLPVLTATFPDGRFVPRWIVVPVAVFFGLTAAYLATDAEIASQPWWFLVGPSSLLLLIAQFYRYLRRATTAERESVRWGILGAILSIDCFVLLALIEGGTIAGHGAWSIGLANVAGIPIPVGLAIGLLRPRVLNVDAALRGVVGFTVAAPVLGIAYWGSGGVADAVGASIEGAAIVGAVVVAVLAVPVIRLAGWIGERLVYRGRSSPHAAVELFARRVAAEPQAGVAPTVLVETIVDALSVAGATLIGDAVFEACIGEVTDSEEMYEGEMNGRERSGAGASRSHPAERFLTAHTAERFPVVYQGEQLAVLAVAPRRGESALTRRDREVVEQLALHAAPALHGARTLTELTAAHTRVVLAREEERRSLRRDLHDDLGPSLAGLGLGAAAIARLSSGTSAEVTELATSLHRDIQAAIGQTREISHDLRPPILDDLGLVEAIRQRTNGQQADELLLTIEAPSQRFELPAAVDLAALRIVQEAVSNVRKHARASVCVVSLAVTEAQLTVRVCDDGIGMPSRVSAGIGLASMRERATELGGTARFIRRAEGGSLITVVLPISAGSVVTS